MQQGNEMRQSRKEGDRAMVENIQKQPVKAASGPLGTSRIWCELCRMATRVFGNLAWARGRLGSIQDRPVFRLASRLSLGPRQGLALVELSGRYLLVTLGGEGLPGVVAPHFIPVAGEAGREGSSERSSRELRQRRGKVRSRPASRSLTVPQRRPRRYA